MLMCKRHSVIHREPQLLAELTVHAQTHSQPESINVHHAHSLDELTSVVTSIDTLQTLIYHHLSITLLLVCVRERKKEVVEALSRKGRKVDKYLPQS